MKTMFKYSLVLFTCFAIGSENTAPVLEEQSFGPYHGYYFSYGNNKGYVLNKGNDKYVGYSNLKDQMSPEYAEELYKSFKEQKPTCPKKEE